MKGESKAPDSAFDGECGFSGLFVSYFAIRTTVDFKQLNHQDVCHNRTSIDCDALVAELFSFAIAVF